jgi:hypothetical protein
MEMIIVIPNPVVWDEPAAMPSAGKPTGRESSEY